MSNVIHALWVLTFGLVIATAPAGAQTLTEANSIPAVGLTESRTYYSDFSASGLATSGTGNTWDLSAATPFGTAASIEYTVPAASPYAASYPSTTICMHRDAGGPNEEWRHYHVDATIAELLGANTDVFDGGRTFCTFPFSMGSTFTDTYSINGGSPNTETDEYVASGQIIAPWGTVPNVVMVSVNGGFSYYFYSADNVLDAIGTYTPGFGADLWRVESSTGINERAELAIGAWPVPARDKVTIKVPFAGTVRFEILDATGRRVHAGTITNGLGDVDVSALVPGTYVTQAIDGAGSRAVGRLVVK
jgi:hypothetical protein